MKSPTNGIKPLPAAPFPATGIIHPAAFLRVPLAVSTSEACMSYCGHVAQQG